MPREIATLFAFTLCSLSLSPLSMITLVPSVSVVHVASDVLNWLSQEISRGMSMVLEVEKHVYFGGHRADGKIIDFRIKNSVINYKY